MENNRHGHQNDNRQGGGKSENLKIWGAQNNQRRRGGKTGKTLVLPGFRKIERVRCGGAQHCYGGLAQPGWAC